VTFVSPWSVSAATAPLGGPSPGNFAAS
jgi:hypothetical protein